jgi:DNA polymerase III alpha subunit
MAPKPELFYHPLVYVLECHQLGLKLLPPSINDPGPSFTVHGDSIRVPVTNIKGLTGNTTRKLIAAFKQKAFGSITDFFSRVSPSAEEFESLVRSGAFDEFGETRTRQFWQAQHLLRTFGSLQSKQGWLVPPPGLEQLPAVPLKEPTHRERLEAETDLFGFAVSGHPLEIYDNIAWESYCPVERLREFVGQTVTMCGLIIEQRTHHQITGEPMKFLTLADWTGIVQTELFAPTYRSYGLQRCATRCWKSRLGFSRMKTVEASRFAFSEPDSHVFRDDRSKVGELIARCGSCIP